MFLIQYLSLPSVKLFSIVTKTERFQHHHLFFFFFPRTLFPKELASRQKSQPMECCAGPSAEAEPQRRHGAAIPAQQGSDLHHCSHLIQPPHTTAPWSSGYFNEIPSTAAVWLLAFSPNGSMRLYHTLLNRKVEAFISWIHASLKPSRDCWGDRRWISEDDTTCSLLIWRLGVVPQRANNLDAYNSTGWCSTSTDNLGNLIAMYGFLMQQTTEFTYTVRQWTSHHLTFKIFSWGRWRSLSLIAHAQGLCFFVITIFSRAAALFIYFL